jgi:hypothetical protein
MSNKMSELLPQSRMNGYDKQTGNINPALGVYQAVKVY